MKSSVIKISLSDIGATVVLLEGAKRTFLLDAGPADTAPEDLKAFLEGLPRRTVDDVLLTHGHSDHIGGANWVRKTYGARVLCHPRARRYLEEPDYELEGYWGQTLQSMEADRLEWFTEYVFKKRGRGPLAVDGTVSFGDRIEDHDLRLRLIEAEGHIEGHFAVLEGRTGLLFVSDAVQGRGLATKDEPPFPVYNDVPAYRRTIRRLLRVGFKQMVSAHPFYPSGTPVMTRGEGIRQLNESLSACSSLEKQVLGFIREKGSVSREEVLSKIAVLHSRERPDQVVALAVDAHLRDLVTRRKVSRRGRRFTPSAHPS